MKKKIVERDLYVNVDACFNCMLVGVFVL